jgi:hypothetical protein
LPRRIEIIRTSLLADISDIRQMEFSGSGATKNQISNHDRRSRRAEHRDSAQRRKTAPLFILSAHCWPPEQKDTSPDRAGEIQSS